VAMAIAEDARQAPRRDGHRPESRPTTA